MKPRVLIIAALGLALALYLVTYVGLGAVFAAAVRVGWSGFAILCLYALGLFLILGAAWCVLAPDFCARGLWVFVWARMVRDAAAEVLAFSQLGGIVLGARAAILHGVATPLAFASMIVDVTTEMMAQIAYIALGVALLSGRARRRTVSGFAALRPRHDRRAGGASPARCCRAHRGGGHQARRDLSCPRARRPFRGASSCRLDRKRDRGMDRLSPDRSARRPRRGDGDREPRLDRKSVV